MSRQSSLGSARIKLFPQCSAVDALRVVELAGGCLHVMATKQQTAETDFTETQVRPEQ